MIFIDLSVALLASLRALRTQLGEIITLDGKVQSLIDCNVAVSFLEEKDGQ